MKPIEARGGSTIDVLSRSLSTRPQDVAQILLERVTGKITPRVATLTNGESMNVVTPEGISVQLWLTGDFEPEVTHTLRTIIQKGMAVWNIGSHIGTRVVQADTLVGRNGHILAFEPTPRTREVLDTNCRGRASQIQTFPYAVGDRTGEVTFRDYGWLASGLNTAAEKSRHQSRPWKKEPACDEITAQMISIDELMRTQWLNSPDVLVVDAEGLELQIFQGAHDTILLFQPIIVFETGDLGGSDTNGCLYYLGKLGYRFFEYIDGKIVLHTIKDVYPEPGNLIAIHPSSQKGILAK